MTKRRVGRRSISHPFFVVLAMLIAMSIPFAIESAYAETVMEPPTSNTYIEGSEFADADTNYGLTTGKIPKAVYFGTNGEPYTNYVGQKQKWWIAGFDASGLVLMCDPKQPLKTNQLFVPTTGLRKYRSEFGVYESSPANDLFPNHYGASEIRSVLNSLATDESYFTQAEQAVMKETTVYNYDFSNSMTYSTTDKLYLAAGCYNSQDVTVGQNAVDSSKAGNEQVHNGLKIGLKKGSPYGSPFTERDSDTFNFWTRSAADDLNNLALHAIPSIQVFASQTNQTRDAVVPAFALDPGNVLFASAAPAGESYTEIDENKTMTFRCDGRDRINSTATFTGNSVAVHYDDSDADFYLYVQGRDSAGDWVFSQKIEWEADFPASYIHHGANLTNCKVWLETVEDNIAYAKPAQFTGAFPPPLYGILTPPAGKKYTYTGKPIHGVNPPIGSCASGFAWGTSVGIYYCDVFLNDGYLWSDGTTAPKTIKWQILQAPNPMKLKTKTATVKKSAVKKKAQKLKRTKVLTFTKSAKGKVTYTKVSGSGKLSIAKSTGTITVKKKTKKGTYSIKVRVKAAGNGSYKALSKNVILKVKVK